MSTTMLTITGMTCGHCVKHTQEALEAVAGVDKVTVTLDPGQASIQGSAEPATLIQAVTEVGYSAVVSQ